MSEACSQFSFLTQTNYQYNIKKRSCTNSKRLVTRAIKVRTVASYNFGIIVAIFSLRTKIYVTSLAPVNSR